MIFEVWPQPDHREDYLQTALKLRGLLEQVDGFISIERFESLVEPGKILSLGFFRDEAALAEWRNTPAHRSAQAMGRDAYFTGYRLRIAEVSRDYSMTLREQAPADSRRVHG